MFNHEMFKLTVAILSLLLTTSAADLPSKKYLNLAAIKTMVAAAEAEARRQHVEVTICIVDESGNLLFLEKGDAAPLNTIQWAQKKARHAAFYKSPSKDAQDTVKKGNVEALAYPDYFPNQGGLPSSPTDKSSAASPPAVPSPKSTRPSPKLVGRAV